MNNQTQVHTTIALNAWDLQAKRADILFNTLTDEQLLSEISPGRNRGIYLLGHLTAVNDTMFSILGLGERLHPELDAAFLSNPDKSGIDLPAISELKNAWTAVNKGLSEHFHQLSAEEWYQKHNSVSEEDFLKEPHRNKLGVLVNRTNHMAYHLGQAALLKK